MNKIIKDSWIFIFGGSAYAFLEVLWRGWTHPVMIIVGGVAFLFIYKINVYLDIKSRILKALLGAFTTTVVELGSGFVINIIFNMDVWDYSSKPLNLFGQICLPYFFLWFLLCLIADEICLKINRIIS